MRLLKQLKKQQFHFDLPKALIAQYPLAHRSDSRLLVYDRTSLKKEHHTFRAITDFLEPGDLLVMNDSKVIPARLHGRKASGGVIELLVERIVTPQSFWAHIRASKAPKPGTILHFDPSYSLEVVGREGDLFHCHMDGDVITMLTQIGHVPLPPYITRTDEALDLSRYQTVYARHNGSVAAPTAGLHFDEVMLANLKEKGVNIAYSTLHVGAGTFRPVRTEYIKDHEMHSEWFSVSEELCEAVRKTRALKKRVIAVGTTALRSLESAALQGELCPAARETSIFIYPGFQFKVCDGLITNFHLPESTLLMLVSAFIGHEATMALYEEAIAHGYRFFSYGDVSLLL